MRLWKGKLLRVFERVNYYNTYKLIIIINNSHNNNMHNNINPLVFRGATEECQTMWLFRGFSSNTFGFLIIFCCKFFIIINKLLFTDHHMINNTKMVVYEIHFATIEKHKFSLSFYSMRNWYQLF